MIMIIEGVNMGVNDNDYWGHMKGVGDHVL